MKIKTYRLDLHLLTEPQLRQLVNKIHIMEADMDFVYQGEPLIGGFADYILSAANALQNGANCVYSSFWLIICRDTRTAVGMASFKGNPDENSNAEIGYGLGEAHRGNGFMTEAVTAICTWTLQRNDVSAIIAETEPDNDASEKVLERCGFVVYDKVDGCKWWKLR